MRNQKGFTLIELIIVIVVLGILAVTAAPQFINFSSDARASTIKGLEGAVNGAANVIYGKASIEGVENQASATLSDGTEVVYGYPAATVGGIIYALDINDADWEYVVPATPNGNIRIVPQDFYNSIDGTVNYATFTGDNECYVQYTAATNPGRANRYSVVTADTDC